MRLKKSGFEDAFFVLAVILAFTIFILIVAHVWNQISPELNEALSKSMPSDSNVNVTKTLDKVQSTTYLFNKMLPFLLLGLFGFIILGAAVYMQHPIMIFVGIIILLVSVLLGAVFGNVYQDLSESSALSSTSSNFGLFTSYMKFLPVLIVIMFIGILIVVFWSKSQGGTGTL